MGGVLTRGGDIEMICPVCGVRVDHVVSNITMPPVLEQDGDDVWYKYPFRCPECGTELEYVEYFALQDTYIVEKRG